MVLQTVSFAATDRIPPTLKLLTVDINPANGKIVTYASVSDNQSAFGTIQVCWNYNPDSSSNAWSTTYIMDLAPGTAILIAAKDEAGNITVVNHYVRWENDNTDNLIENIDLSISGYKLSKHIYIDELGLPHTYISHPITGEACLPVEVTVGPAFGGYLGGYAQLNTGIKYPLYWGTDTNSNQYGTATFYITASSLTSSQRNATITLYVAEYTDASMTKKACTDSLVSVVLIDVTPPSANISLNKVTGMVTIVAQDTLAGLETLQYATENGSGSVSAYTSYTGSFALPSGTKYIHVKAVDKLKNESITASIALEIDEEGNGASGENEDLTSAATKVYRTPRFYCYLIGTNKS